MNLTNFLAQLDIEQRKEFCRLAGTKHTHLYQLLGGHRAASARLLWAMVVASADMFPRCRRKRLTLDELHGELLTRQRSRQAKNTGRVEA